MRFRLVPKSMTLVDLELTLNGCYALCYIIHIIYVKLAAIYLMLY